MANKKNRGRGRKAPPFAIVKSSGEVGKVLKYHGWNRFRLQLPNGEQRSFHRERLIFTDNPTNQESKP